jgi:hypothetical protein
MGSVAVFRKDGKEGGMKKLGIWVKVKSALGSYQPRFDVSRFTDQRRADLTPFPTMHTSSGQDFWDSFFSDAINRLKRLGLGFLGAYLVLVLLTLGAAAAGFLVIGSWDNLVILLMMILVPAMLLGFLYYLIGEFVLVPRAQLAVVALFLVVLVVPALISRSQDSKVILELMILSCAAFFVLLCCAIHFIPSLRERKGVFLGMGIGMWTGFGVSAVWGPTWGSFFFSGLATACLTIGGYLGYKIVDQKGKQ